MTEEEQKRAHMYSAEIYNQPKEAQNDSNAWNQWERDYRSQGRSDKRKMVNNMIAAAKNSEDIKRAVEVATQYSTGNVVEAFDEDDIRRFKRLLRERQAEEEEVSNKQNQEANQIILEIQTSLRDRDPERLEKALPSNVC